MTIAYPLGITFKKSPFYEIQAQLGQTKTLEGMEQYWTNMWQDITMGTNSCLKS
jgi:hypothetical protein